MSYNQSQPRDENGRWGKGSGLGRFDEGQLLEYGSSELGEVQVDENFNDDDYSEHVDNALSRGFDKDYPIVVDEDGLIIDGNHRFVAFKNAGRLHEVSFVKVDYGDFTDLQSKLIDEGLDKKFNKDDGFFYDQIKTIVKDRKSVV